MNTYQENYVRQYLTKSGTFQHLFCIFIWYLILALPFYFSFGGQNFWKKGKNQMMSCQYNFTGYYALQVNYISNNVFASEQYSNIVGSTMNSLSGLTGFQVQDNVQSSSVSFSLNQYSSKQVQNINLILYYKIYVVELKKEISAAFVQHFDGDLSYGEVSGVIRYEPESELNEQFIPYHISIDNNQLLNYPAYLPNLQPPSSFDALLDHIVTNPEVHRISKDLMTISTDSQQAATRLFKISLFKDTKVNIPYFPSVLETLKFSFSTWLAFAIIAYFVFYKLMEKLVKDGALQTKLKDQIVK